MSILILQDREHYIKLQHRNCGSSRGWADGSGYGCGFEDIYRSGFGYGCGDYFGQGDGDGEGYGFNHGDGSGIGLCIGFGDGDDCGYGDGGGNSRDGFVDGCGGGYSYDFGLKGKYVYE